MAIVYLLISIVLIVWLTARFKVHPFITLFTVALFYGLISGMSYEKIIESINTGFGDTIGKIGAIIVFGVIIGTFLENSGGAFRLAEGILKIVGQKRIIPAMGVIGYIISIPVFCDSGYMLLSPLNKSLAKRAGISLAGPGIALAIGLMATHTMVPPTPGPIGAAGILNANIGLVMGIGLIISIVGTVAGVIFALKVASKTMIDPAPEITEKQIADRLSVGPGLTKSSLPVVIPIALIVVKSLIGPLPVDAGSTLRFLAFIGEPVIALAIGVLLSFTLPARLSRNMLSTDGWIGKSLQDAATIILVTGAGGIFGRILQNSGIADSLGDQLSGLHLGILVPFIISAAIKAAQGSSTVAMITTASILLPVMTPLGFSTEVQKAMAVVAIGAGAATFSHANDSYFWVVTQLCGMDVKTGYRLHTAGTTILGLSSGIALFALYLVIG